MLLHIWQKSRREETFVTKSHGKSGSKEVSREAKLAV